MHQAESIVGKCGIVLRDSKRGKDLEVSLTYPRQPGRYPLIVFSHGAFGSKDGYGPLAHYWSENGLIVARPMHEDSLRYFAKERIANLSQNQDQTRFTSSGERKASLDDAFNKFKHKSFQNWQARPRDISFLLDQLDSLDDELGQKQVGIERNSIGVGGHSFGAHTAQVLAGTIIGGSCDLEDQRPRAFVLLSPQGMEEGFDGRSPTDENSWGRLIRPTMSITGTRDLGRHGEEHSWRFHPFTYSPPGDKYLVVVRDGHHGLGGIAGRHFQGAGPNNCEHVRIVQQLSLAFWQAYLTGSSTAMSYLKQHEDEDALVEFSRK